MNNKSHGLGGLIRRNGSPRLRGLDNKGGLLPMSLHRIISFGKLKHILVCLGLALFLVSVVIPADLSHAQKRYKPEVVLPPQYPDGFHGFGRIDVLYEDRIVIGDLSIKLTPFVTYHTPTNMNSYSADFNPSDLVGWLKNLEGEIISLWLIE